MTEELKRYRDTPLREIDRAVAERIFGYDPLNARRGLHADGDLEYYCGYPLGHALAPRYSTYADADYTVLDAVRKMWRNRPEAMTFMCYLRETWADRPRIHDGIFNGGELAGAYKPGDYSRAALVALDLAAAEKGTDAKA